jgi:hypothetical protein
MKWGGRYGPEYVNRLFAMVQRHLGLPHRFVCLTDDVTGIWSAIETLPLPAFPGPQERLSAPWPKLALFEPHLHDLEGTALFLDLDLVIVGGLRPFFEYLPGNCCLIRARGKNNPANSSVMRFEIGSLADIAADFRADPDGIAAHWRNSQSYLADRLGPRLRFWPTGWCRSFRHHCLRGWGLDRFLPARLPRSARVIVFPGRPKPVEAMQGYRDHRGRHRRATSWVAEHWR